MKDDQPTIGVIEKILVVDGDKVAFKVQSHTTMYQPHYRAYIMDCNSTTKIVWHAELFTSSAVHIHTSHIYELFYFITFCTVYSLIVMQLC